MSGLHRFLRKFFPSPAVNFKRAIARRRWALLAAIGLTGTSWIAATNLVPPAAIAYSSRASVTLERQGQETYETFLRRAEAIARAATQRRFDSDILVTEVSITIVGQNNGAAMPVLTLNVSRNDWRKQPDPQRWTRYFRNAAALLGFEPLPAASPGATPPPPPPEPTPVEAPSPEEPVPPNGVPLPPNAPGNPPRPAPIASPAGTATPTPTPSPGARPTPTPTPSPRTNVRPTPTPTPSPRTNVRPTPTPTPTPR